jgi:two-component system chemotaxis response regulator CheY
VPFETEALAVKPTDVEEAKRLVKGVIRVRQPSRVLVVDESSIMRSIVRKTLAATRFPLNVTEAAQRLDAIELARTAVFDIVLVDYNMPGFNGLETIAKFRREKRRVTFVLITSTQDQALADRAHTGGRLSQEAVLPRRYRGRVVRLLRIAGAQPQAGVTVGGRLLARQLHREFAIADPWSEVLGIARRRFFAVGGNELHEREEERGLRQAIAVDAVVVRFRPGLLQIAERQPLLLVIRYGLASRDNLRRHFLAIILSPRRGNGPVREQASMTTGAAKSNLGAGLMRRPWLQLA